MKTNNFFNKSFFFLILKLLGIIQIIVLVFFVYISVALEKDEIKGLIHSVAQQTYWFGKMLTSLPIKWSNQISSKHPMLNIEIASKDYQFLMTLKNNAIKKEKLLQKNKKKISVVIKYKNDIYDAQIRLKGDDPIQHLKNAKWSMRVEIKNNRFLDMKAFNLQHPERRSYLASFVLHKFIENENLITKKFNLIPVTINGKYKGIYNYEEVPDHNMIERLTGTNNIVIFVDDDNVVDETQYGSKLHAAFLHTLIDNKYYNSRIKAHSFNEILSDEMLKKDFERASKLLNGYRTRNLTASEVFDIDKVALWLAMTDLFGADHQVGFNIKLIYDRDLDRLYPTVWDAISNNVFSSVGFHKYNMFKFVHVYKVKPEEGSGLQADQMSVQLLSDQMIVEKYLTKLDEITVPAYIDNVIEIIKPEADEYMSILHLDYPQFKIEDEINRLKENAEYLRSVYLYPEIPFNAYLSGDDNQDNLILVNRKPVPIKIVALANITTDQQFKVKGTDSGLVLENNIPGEPATPTKVFFECPMEDCFAGQKIENLRIVSKVVGTSKTTLVKINNWTAYDIN